MFTLQKGFTLVELLVTVAIIGILSSVLLVNFSAFRARARDTQRQKDLFSIQTAIELYRADAGAYPNALPNRGSALTFNTATYLRSMPCDPLGSPAWGANYYYSTNGSTYTLYSCLENGSDVNRDSSKQGGCGSAPASLTKTSP